MDTKSVIQLLRDRGCPRCGSGIEREATSDVWHCTNSHCGWSFWHAELGPAIELFQWFMRGCVADPGYPVNGFPSQGDKPDPKRVILKK